MTLSSSVFDSVKAGLKPNILQAAEEKCRSVALISAQTHAEHLQLTLR